MNKQFCRQLIRFIGRALLLTLLIPSCLTKFKNPQLFITQFKQKINSIYQFFNEDVFIKILKIKNTNIVLNMIKLFGITEGVLGVMIIFGQRNGGLILFMYLNIYLLINCLCVKTNGNFELLDNKIQFVRLIGIIGLSCCLSGKKTNIQFQ